MCYHQTNRKAFSDVNALNNFNQDMLERVKQSLDRKTDLGKHPLQTPDLLFIHKQH